MQAEIQERNKLQQERKKHIFNGCICVTVKW